MENPLAGIKTKKQFEWKLFYDGDSFYLNYLLFKLNTSREQLKNEMRKEAKKSVVKPNEN